MNSVAPGRVLVTLVALWSAFGSYGFDWNETHIFNAAWPPHAKFHNAQTMLLGTAIGLFSVWTLWIFEVESLKRLRFASVLASFYWLTQMGALLFPGTALIDPNFAARARHPHS